MQEGETSPVDTPDLAAVASLTTSASGFRDGLGERAVAFDRASGRMFEVLQLRPELAALHTIIGARIELLTLFHHRRCVRTHGLTRIPGDARAVAVSDYVAGPRLSELLELARERQEPVDINAALYLIRRILPALIALHESGGVAHGTFGADRVAITARGRPVIVESVFGSAIESLELAPHALWQQMRIAVPWGASAVRCDMQTDILQAALLTLALILGRVVQPSEYPDRLRALLDEATEITPLGLQRPLAPALRAWIERSLRLDPSRPFQSLADARRALEAALAAHARCAPTRSAFLAFLERIGQRGASPPKPTHARAGLAPTSTGLPAGDDVPRPSVPPPAPTVQQASQPDVPSRVARVPVPDAPQLPVSPSLASIAEPVGSQPAGPPPGPDTLLRLKQAVVSAPEGGGPTGTGTSPRVMAVPAPSQRTVRRTATKRHWVLALAAAVMLAVLNGAVGTPRWAGALASKRAAAAEAGASGVAATSGLVRLLSDPEGARVIVDSVPRGVTPLLLGDVPAGRHIVVFESPAGTVRRVIQVEAGTRSELSVPIYSGWVGVYAPLEVQVIEEGRLLGTTTESVQIMLPPGRHELVLANDSYGYRERRLVDISPGALTRLHVELPHGTLHLNAVPWAEVWIDGERAGRTPLTGVPTPVGTREIVFRHPEFGERREAIVVKVGPPTLLTVDLTR